MMIRICYKTPQGPLSVDFTTMYQAIHFLRLVSDEDFISMTKVYDVKADLDYDALEGV